MKLTKFNCIIINLCLALIQTQIYYSEALSRGVGGFIVVQSVVPPLLKHFQSIKIKTVVSSLYIVNVYLLMVVLVSEH